MKRKLFKKALWILVVIASVLMLSVVGTVIYVATSDDLVPFDKTKLNSVNDTLTLLDVFGEKIDEPLYVNNFRQVSLESLPEYTPKAFISIEDKRFYRHDGLDTVRIVGALCSNLKSFSFKEGASTISQQLIKNTHLSSGKTLKRKINEIILARQLERNFSKEQILEMYLNTIYFGKNAYGIESAANIYFDKSAADLTVSESAVLAGLIKAPSAYSPAANREKCLNRRNVVLKCMKNEGYIGEEQYRNALNEDIRADVPQSRISGYTYGAIRQAADLLHISQLQLLNSGLTVETYLDPHFQSSLTNAVKEDKTENCNLSAVVADNATFGVKAFVTRGETDGEKRQIGSAAKPIAVYAPAFNEKKITEASSVLDEKTNFAGYFPKNYNDRYVGWTTVRNAVAKSMNVPAIKVLNSVGTDVSRRYLRKMGVAAAENEQNLSLALGNVNGGMDIYELTQCYVTLANGGNSGKLSFIKSIRNDKSVLYEHKNAQSNVFSAEAVFLTTDCLQNTVREGTASVLAKLPYQVAAKTGTVGDEKGNSDALICGYTSQDTFCVWLRGRDTLQNEVTGGGAPAKIALHCLKNGYRTAPENFKVPEGVTELNVDEVTLQKQQVTLLANGQTKEGETARYYFAKDNAPTEYSDRNLQTAVELHLSVENDFVKITANREENCRDYLHKSDGEKENILPFDGEYTDTETTAGGTYCYFLERRCCGKKIGESRRYTVTLPEKPSAEPDPGILDWWYILR